MKKLIGFGLISLIGFAGTAEARYISKKAMANRATAHASDPVAQTTIVGRTKNSAAYYGRQELTKNGQKMVRTVMIDANSGKVLRSSGQQLGKIKQYSALRARNGVKGGQSGDLSYSIRPAHNALSESGGGHVKVIAENAGFPGRADARTVKLTKTGAIKGTQDSGTGANSRW